MDDRLEVELGPVTIEERAAVAAAIASTRPAIAFQISDGGERAWAELVERARPRAEEAGVTVATDTFESEHGRQAQPYFFVEDAAQDAHRRLRAFLAALAPELDAAHELLVEREAGGWRSHHVRKASDVTGEDIAAADVAWDPDTERPEVLVTFTDAGKAELEATTRAALGRKLVLRVGDLVMMAPVVIGVISGGKVTVTRGAMEPAELLGKAQRVVQVLRAGQDVVALARPQVR